MVARRLTSTASRIYGVGHQFHVVNILLQESGVIGCNLLLSDKLELSLLPAQSCISVIVVLHDVHSRTSELFYQNSSRIYPARA